MPALLRMAAALLSLSSLSVTGRGALPDEGSDPGDSCRGYFDVMGQYDEAFNCTSASFLFCCGTCHYRFCCEFSTYRLAQGACDNYQPPPWAQTPSPPSPAYPPASGTHLEDYGERPGHDGSAPSNLAVYVVGGCLVLALLGAAGLRVVCRRFGRRPRDLDVSRALVNILRHQSVSVQDIEQNNLTNSACVSPPNEKLCQVVKNNYTPKTTNKTCAGVSSQIWTQSGENTLQHIKANAQPNFKFTMSPAHCGTLPLDRSRRQRSQQPCGLSSAQSHHNLSQTLTYQRDNHGLDANRYSSLCRLAGRDVDDCCQRRLMAELTARGTLPLPPRACRENAGPFNARRVMSQDQLLSGEAVPSPGGATVPRPRPAQSRERLYSPERRIGPSYYMPERPLGHKALSQGNLGPLAPTYSERHQMVKMNSHPPGVSPGGYCRTLERRQAFAAKRHSTVEQLHFIPGHPAPPATAKGEQRARTGSRAEVTV